MSWEKKGILTGLALGMAGGALALYQGLTVRRYTLTTPKLSANLRLLSVSDFHSALRNPSKLLNLMAAQKPDIILLPGDIVDDRRPVSGAAAFLAGAAQIAPAFFAPGNHEYRTRRIPQIVRLAKRHHIIPLLNRSVTLSTPGGPLVIAGCEDSEKTRRFDPAYRQTEALPKAFWAIPHTEAYTVLMAHRPEHISLYRTLGFDLVLSGHAHGGQVRIPWVMDGLFASGQGLFPPYAGGCYRYPETAHIIGRGVAVYRMIPRVFNPPEVVVVDLMACRTPDIEADLPGQPTFKENPSS